MSQLITIDYYKLLEPFIIERKWEFEDNTFASTDYGERITIRDRYLIVEVKYRLPNNLIMDRSLINQQIVERKMYRCDIELESNGNRICTIVYRINERDL